MGPAGAGPMVSCRRRTVLIIVGVVALVFLIAVAVPAGKQDIGTKRQSQHHPGRQSKNAPSTAKPRTQEVSGISVTGVFRFGHGIQSGNRQAAKV